MRIMPTLAKAYAFVSEKTCGCDEYAELMDTWGVAGCERRKDEIADRLVSKAPEVLQGLGCIRAKSEKLVTEAIDTARAKEPTTCRCGRKIKVAPGEQCYWCQNKERLSGKGRK